nr:retrotransposon Orf1 [Tanacetum cinerariifolium]
MTNKIKIVLKAITDQIAGIPPRNTVKNTKLSTSLVLSTRSYLNMDPQCLNHIHDSINTVTIHSKQQTDSYDEKANENDEEEKKSPENIHVNSSTQPDLLVAFITKKVLKFNSFFESLGQVPQSSDTEVVCTKRDDGEVMFIEIIRNNDDSREDGPEEEGRIKGMHVFVRNLTYVIDFIIVKDISSIIEPRLSQVVLGKPFVKISNMTHDPPQGVVTFNNGTNEVSYNIPHKIEQYKSFSYLEKELTKSVYLRNEEDKRRGVEYVMSKILGFYKERLELGPEYVIGIDDEGEVT